MSKWEPPKRGNNSANHAAARHLAQWSSLRVEPLARCHNCQQHSIVVHVSGYDRCQPCANHLISLVSEMRSERDEQS